MYYCIQTHSVFRFLLTAYKMSDECIIALILVYVNIINLFLKS